MMQNYHTQSRVSRIVNIRNGVIAVSTLVFAVLAVASFSVENVFQNNRIGSDTYAQIIESKDLTADILPPPLLPYEAELIINQMRYGSDDQNAAQAGRIKQLRADYYDRLNHWIEVGNGRNIQEPQWKNLMGALKENGDAFWDDLEGRVVPAILSHSVATEMLLSGSMAKMLVIDGKIKEALDYIGRRAEMAEQRSADSSKAGITALLITGGALALVLFGLIFIVNRLIVRAINRLARCLSQLATGHLDIDVPYRSRPDEVGNMAKSIAVLQEHERESAQMRDKQEKLKAESEAARHQAQEEAISSERNLVMRAVGSAMEKIANGDLTYRLDDDLPAAYANLRHNFNDAIATFEAVISKLSQSTLALDSGTQEITTASDDLNRRTEQQAASLEETAAAVTEITKKLRETASGANQAQAVVASAKTEAANSDKVVKQAIDAMRSIEGSSGQITSIIGVIDDIAFQTNLLALNAGVEAARAGDAGRGFAVVAQEVRGLAQRSADAAKQIKALIASSHAEVQQGVHLVGETGTALANIVKRVVEINDVVAMIARSASEQAETLGQVNNAVDNMDKTTQQNAAMVEETSAATHQLAHLTKDLTGLVAGFSVRGNTKAGKAAKMAAGETADAAKNSGSVSPRLQRTGTDSWQDF